jgi:hypothetical protein
MDDSAADRAPSPWPGWVVAGVLAVAVVVLALTNSLAIADSSGQEQRIEPVVGGSPTPSPSEPATPAPESTSVPAPPPVDVDDDDDPDDDDDDVDDG